MRTLDIRDVQLQDFGGAGEDLTDRWPKLFELRLIDVNLSAAAVREIAAMPALKVLVLHGVPADGAALGELGASKSLYHLVFSSEAPEAAAIERLAAIPTLEALELRGARVDDNVLRSVAQLQQLTTLVLDDTQVTDEGIDALRNHPHLRTIRISGGIGFTYRSLETLASIPTFSFRNSIVDVPGFNPLIVNKLRSIESRGDDAIQYLRDKELLPAAPPQP